MPFVNLRFRLFLHFFFVSYLSIVLDITPLTLHMIDNDNKIICTYKKTTFVDKK